jgi:hypothetical protein
MDEIYFERAKHMAWVMSKCPPTKVGDLFESLEGLTPHQYFDIMEWAFNQTTATNPAFSDVWIDRIIVEAQIETHNLSL